MGACTSKPARRSKTTLDAKKIQPQSEAERLDQYIRKRQYSAALALVHANLHLTSPGYGADLLLAAIQSYAPPKRPLSKKEIKNQELVSLISEMLYRNARTYFYLSKELQVDIVMMICHRLSGASLQSRYSSQVSFCLTLLETFLQSYPSVNNLDFNQRNCIHHLAMFSARHDFFAYAQHTAIWKIIELLALLGNDKYAIDRFNKTPLIYCCANLAYNVNKYDYHLYVCKVLIAGADLGYIQHKDNLGLSALSYAVVAKSTHVIKVIEDRICQINKTRERPRNYYSLYTQDTSKFTI